MAFLVMFQIYNYNPTAVNFDQIGRSYRIFENGYDPFGGVSILNIPIGQGVSVTLAQIAEAYGAIANRGRMVPPHVVKKIGDKAETVKDLAYILYDISANKRQDAKEATAYNALIADWTEVFEDEGKL